MNMSESSNPEHYSLIQQTKQVMIQNQTQHRATLFIAMLAHFKVVNIVDVSVLPTGMLLGRFNLPGNSPESEIQIERKKCYLWGDLLRSVPCVTV